ncbi:MAG: hypothetical protein JWR18_977 [Segetibacter sp.]|nr:hypothetical protein [Segetibacter sp.]
MKTSITKMEDSEKVVSKSFVFYQSEQMEIKKEML